MAEYDTCPVSTHAPVRARLRKTALRVGIVMVSTHAPVRARPYAPRIELFARGFNSRAREGATK